MQIRAVLFDLDNTLFDHPSSARAGVDAFLQHLGTEGSNELTRCWFQIEEVNYNRFLANELTFQEQRRERLRQFLPLAGLSVPQTSARIDELFNKYLENYEDAWMAFPDAAPALKNLRAIGMPVGIIINGNHDQQTSKVNRIGLEPLLDRVFSYEHINHAKPAQETFLQPCRSMNVSPTVTLYIGDNYRVDVEGARNAGLQALHLNREGSMREGTIQSLAELPLRLVEGSL
ncbi:HAD family hydrolase [Paenarthrobacter sp. OM7]|uniref:HAD family hydrolase n=1 Tax=Paenarthrobacter sp. OM7 TaxID=3041264 RepID=UPI0024682FB5|nr:HAD family hydrolase [Paenarthrobacter sp. OM7]WGM19851.1 HAD family hydrolase [Paenarthrobacter sp. OM7]